MDDASENLRAFLTYVNEGRLMENDFIHKIDKEVGRVRESKEWLKGVSAEDTAEMLEENVADIQRIMALLDDRDMKSDEEILSAQN